MSHTALGESRGEDQTLSEVRIWPPTSAMPYPQGYSVTSEFSSTNPHFPATSRHRRRGDCHHAPRVPSQDTCTCPK